MAAEARLRAFSLPWLEPLLVSRERVSCHRVDVHNPGVNAWASSGAMKGRKRPSPSHPVAMGHS